MPQGGNRAGAGRPKGQGKFGQKTKPIRVPETMIEDIMRYIEGPGFELPLYSSSVSAGFPSPADDYMEGKLDLNKYLIKHPAATFFVRVSGESMIKAGIYPNDILVVDRSLDARHGKIVIAAVDGYLTVKRLHKLNGQIVLMPENNGYEPLEITNNNDVVIWGVVTTVLHQV